MISAEHRLELEAFFNEYETWVLATERDHEPWIAASYFAQDYTDGGDLRFYCTFRVGSRKLEYLHLNSRCAFYIGPHLPVKWIQGTANAYFIADEIERQHAIRRLLEHSPHIADFLALAKVEVLRFMPTRMKYANYSQGRRPPIEFTFDEQPAEISTGY
ncbi:MAG: hypothetical protein HY326_11810 [Chloroflexi bacterium]|nr:hypothetical protein [Chloroflexota bacterium]